jgi:hypothetical protein
LFRCINPHAVHSGFNRPYETGSVIESALGACPAKLHDLFEAHASPIAKEALERIATLHGIEKEIRGRPPDERQKIRDDRSSPRLESMKEWFKVSLSKLSRIPTCVIATEDGLIEAGLLPSNFMILIGKRKDA